MKCPHCDYQSPYERARCPQCSTVFDNAALEELAHLDYLQDRLDAWRHEGLLPPRVAARILREADRQVADLELALGLRAAPAEAVEAPAAAAAPVARPLAAPPEPVAPPPERAVPPPAPAPPAPEAPPAAAPPLPPAAAPAAAPSPFPRPPSPSTLHPAPSPSFSWSQLGAALLSERTLNTLLALGAFLILASGVVISTLNPTGLSPWPHLGVVAATTLVFYAFGYFVRQRLGLTVTGTTLLGIGAAFIPLTMWTLGQAELLNWDPGAIWLAASFLCLPVYLASYGLLRDRTFALLASPAGGSELLALLNWLGVPLEWGLCALLGLAVGYVALSRRLAEGWQTLSWALLLSARVATPAAMAALLGGKDFPVAWEAVAGRSPGGLFEYAVGVAWWLGTAFYALSARLFGQRRYAFAAAWLLPFAFLFTLTKAPWDGSWYNLCLALLAVAYLAYGGWREGLAGPEPISDSGGLPAAAVASQIGTDLSAGLVSPAYRPGVRGLGEMLRQPAYQVGLALTAVAGLWPWQTLDSRIPTLYLVFAIYALASRLLGLAACRYVAAYLLPVAVVFTLEKLYLVGAPGFERPWHGLAFALLATGYLLFGRFVLRAGRDATGRFTPTAFSQEPVYQVFFLLTILAGVWPFQTPETAATALWAVSGAYALAAHLFRLLAFRYVAAYLLPVAVGLTLDQLARQGVAGFERPWHGLAFALLATGYLLFGRFVLRASRPGDGLSTPTTFALEPVYQVFVLLTVLAALSPYQTLESAAAALWVVAGAYVVAAYLFRLLAFRYVAAYLLPVAFGLTLEQMARQGVAGFERPWQALAFALLAAGYLLFGRFVLGSGRPHVGAELALPSPGAQPAAPLPPARRDGTGYLAVAAEPVYQVALLLTGVAALWPVQVQESRTATFGALALLYGAAALLLQQRAWAYVSALLVLPAFALLLGWVGLEPPAVALAWALLPVALLAAAEVAARRSGEARRPLLATAIGLGAWRSLFASPLFLVGYAGGLAALWLCLGLYLAAPAAALVRSLDLRAIAALAALVAALAASAATRRTSFFLFLAAPLLLLPGPSAVGLYFRHFFERQLPEHQVALLLAVLGVGYLGIALLVDRARGHYAKPLYLVGYGLSLATMLFSSLDRGTNTLVVGLSLMVYAASAWLVHAGRHPSYLWLVERLSAEPASTAFLTGRGLFVYLASWLFPVWLLLAMSLWDPTLPVAGYGLALTLLAPGYVAAGLAAGRWLRPEYRHPFYIAGYALSGIGPLVATADTTLRALALAISIALYMVSARLFRRSAWVYLVALLTPLLLWQALDWLQVSSAYFGPGLVGLGLAYALAGLLLHHGRPSRMLRPIDGTVGSYALPFFATGYAASALGLALAANQESGLVVLGFALAALHYAWSAYALRQSLFTYPLAASAAVAYVVGLTMTPLEAQHYGLGLLPGIVAYLAAAELLRRGPERSLTVAAQTPSTLHPAPFPLRPDSWATPFYLLVYAGAVVAPFLCQGDQGAWALAWWGTAAVLGASAALFRHPGWLYPAIGAGLVAYLATAYALAPGLASAWALASLAGPAWVLAGVAYAVARRGLAPAVTWPWPALGAGRALARPWAAPCLVGGGVALALGGLGAQTEPSAGLWTAAAVFVLLGALATAWQGEAEAGASLAFGAVAFEQGLRVAGVPLVDRPPIWAVVALASSLLTLAAPRLRLPLALVWQRPLYWGAMGLGAAAVVGALAEASRQTLQPLAATLAVSGLTLLAHAFDRRQRLLGYLGVALVEAGYMLQLLFFDVGQPQAFSLPAGLYLLAIAYLEWRRGAQGRLKGALEAGALALMLAVSLPQAVGFMGAGNDRYFYDTFLLVQSLALVAGGALLRWKKSFFGGSLALVADVVVLLADPVRATNTWYLVGIIGLGMIGIVVFIERQRQRIPLWVDEWRQRLETWD